MVLYVVSSETKDPGVKSETKDQIGHVHEGSKVIMVRVRVRYMVRVRVKLEIKEQEDTYMDPKPRRLYVMVQV